MGSLNTVRRALWKIGVDVRRYREDQAADDRFLMMLDANRIETVLDIGANTGQFAKALLQSGFQGNITSFEPLPEAHAELQATAQRWANQWTVAPRFALGVEEGETDFFVAGNSVSSSLLPMAQMHMDALPTSAATHSVKVSVRRLDAVMSELRLVRPFLKIDTQGAEHLVLDGLGACMADVAGFRLEMSLAQLYEGQLSDVELRSRLEREGFSLWDMSEAFSDSTSGRLLQYDGVFFRG